MAKFGEEVLKESARVAKQPLGDREDLTHLPIVAIDPADARDHDDAVWASEDDDPKNAGGWKALVAIADVSFYVRPGSALDREARRRKFRRPDCPRLRSRHFRGGPSPEMRTVRELQRGSTDQAVLRSTPRGWSGSLIPVITNSG